MNSGRFAVVALVLFFSACQSDQNCQHYNYANQFNYETDFNQSTPQGIALDLSGQDISPELIDRLVDEVEKCLVENFGNPPVLPPVVVQDAQCRGKTFSLPIDRGCLAVKIPNDWQISCDGTQQVLPISSTVYVAPDELCEAKGLTVTPECPCRWRAGIQDDYILVSTPSLYVFKDPLIRMITGCNNPWGHPALSQCASPHGISPL